MDERSVDDVLWACLGEKSTFLEEFKPLPLPWYKRRLYRFRYWKQCNIWQRIHDWAERHGAYCHDW